jgi:MFS family permease
LTAAGPAGPTRPIDRLLLPTVFLVFATAVANTTSGAVAQPEIAEAFGAGAADVGAIVFGYSAAMAMMTAVNGALARRFGLGRCLTIGIGLVAVGALIAVLAPSLPVLVAARVLQGFGAGAIPTLSMALVARRLTGPARARALGLNVAAVGVGFAAGPLVGGVLLEAFGWRGAMALGLLVAPATLIVPRLAPEPGDRGARLDPIGIALLAVGVAGIVLSINRIPLLGIVPLTAGLVAATLLAWTALVWHSRRVHEPALPLRELADPVLRRSMLLGYVGQTAFFGVLVLAPLLAAAGYGVDGFRLGLVLVPMAVAIALVSPRNGRVAERIGRRATTTLSLSVIAIGALALAWLGTGVPLTALEVALVVTGVGFGLLSAPLVNEVTIRFPDARRPLALGIYNLAFFLGSASGGAISTGFVQGRTELPGIASSALVGATSALLVLAALPLLAAAFDQLRPALASGPGSGSTEEPRTPPSPSAA